MLLRMLKKGLSLYCFRICMEYISQAREFDGNGNPVRDIDFTDHGRSEEHDNPHQHMYRPNKTGGTMNRGDPEPLE